MEAVNDDFGLDFGMSRNEIGNRSQIAIPHIGTKGVDGRVQPLWNRHQKLAHRLFFRFFSTVRMMTVPSS